MAPPRRNRPPKSYRRSGPSRDAYEYLAIVCEGEKTEPYYFQELRADYGLSSANIQITPAPGTDPLSVVTYAEKLLIERSFDKVYCVFDRDQHDTYNAAIRRIDQLPEALAGRIVAVPSWPCFEFWLLLHFGYTTAPIVSTQNKSSGDVAVSKLESNISGYKKGHKGVYESLKPRLKSAIKFAKQLERHNSATGSTNPATLVHTLVGHLTNLKLL
jgi:hypothetical protein